MPYHCLGLLYAQMLGNRVNCTIIFNVLVNIFVCLFLSFSESFGISIFVGYLMPNPFLDK